MGMAILACYGAGLFGSLFIDASAGSWYDSLIKPFFIPPSWVFFYVWLILYGLMAGSLAIVWIKDPHADDFRGWVPMFFVHLLANMAWIIFFFGFHATFIALVDILILQLAVFLLFCGAYEIDRRASWLLLPYMIWLLFAFIINVAVWYLN